MNLSDEFLLAVDKYTDAMVDAFEAGELQRSEYEHARSYAVEALTQLLRDNPDTFPYLRRMQAVSDRRKAR
jgi:hypothetical protein